MHIYLIFRLATLPFRVARDGFNLAKTAGSLGGTGNGYGNPSVIIPQGSLPVHHVTTQWLPSGNVWLFMGILMLIMFPTLVIASKVQEHRKQSALRAKIRREAELIRELTELRNSITVHRVTVPAEPKPVSARTLSGQRKVEETRARVVALREERRLTASLFKVQCPEEGCRAAVDAPCVAVRGVEAALVDREEGLSVHFSRMQLAVDTGMTDRGKLRDMWAGNVPSQLNLGE